MPRRFFAFLLVLSLSRCWAASIEIQVTDTKDHPVADAVVSLTPLDATAKVPASSAPAEIVQQGQEFSPFVTAVRVGETVVFPNHDTVQHHIYSLSKPKKFELPLYRPGKSERVVFEQPGIVVLGCNIHDWMSAYVVVLDTPWFAKTSVDGRGSITAPPVGRYRIEVWHPRLAKTEIREATISPSGPNASLKFVLSLKPDRRIRRSPEAAGGGYK